ncbi:MAG: hypothetical protein E7397_08720 [Ruminococcaceae bacterium]|nr:hypothetical protein [Oscillospiraceae bacterium]
MKKNILIFVFSIILLMTFKTTIYAFHATTATDGDVFFAIKNDKSLWFFETVNHNENTYSEPIQIMEDVSGISMRMYPYLSVIKEDDSLWLIQKEDIYTPIKIMEHVAQVSNGGTHTLIVTKDNELWGYGWNEFGQLGLSEEYYDTPQKLMRHVRQAAAGENHSIILKTDGSVWTFGENSKGQLGHTKNTNQIPTKIMENAMSVFAGAASGYALSTEQQLYFWGSLSGNLIGGNQIFHFEPEPITEAVRTVITPHEFSLLVRSDSSLWLYGNSPQTEAVTFPGGHSVFAPLKIADNINSVSGWCNDANQMLALKEDGSLYVLSFANAKHNETPYTFIPVLNNVKQVTQAPVAPWYFTDSKSYVAFKMFLFCVTVGIIL